MKKIRKSFLRQSWNTFILDFLALLDLRQSIFDSFTGVVAYQIVTQVCTWWAQIDINQFEEFNDNKLS